MFIEASFGILVFLSAVLLSIGWMASDCPGMRRRVRVTAAVAAAAFAVIGLGIVSIYGGFLYGQYRVSSEEQLIAFGAVSVTLGVGFLIAVTQLNAVLERIRQSLTAEQS